MKGKRIFDRFGFNAPDIKVNKNAPAKLLSAFNKWQYNSKSCDWENTNTGELLSGFKLPTHLRTFRK